MAKKRVWIEVGSDLIYYLELMPDDLAEAEGERKVDDAFIAEYMDISNRWGSIQRRLERLRTTGEL